MPLNPWTDQAIDALKRGWADGMSCAQISKLIQRETGLTFTRNAVIGKRFRLGLPERWSKASVTRDTLLVTSGLKPRRNPNGKPPRPLRPVRLAQKAPPYLAAREPQSDSVPWVDRPAGGCQWIFGEPSADALCCGRPALPGSPYCAEHHALTLNHQHHTQREAA